VAAGRGPGHAAGVFEVRELTPEDWPIWRELRLCALAEAPHAFGARLADWQGAGDRPERWRDRLAIPGSYNIVVVLDGRPVGMASGVPGEAGAELISMWVEPAARGRGAGDRLMVAVQRWAWDAGARQVRLAVADGNEAAITLYRRHGFRDTGEPGDLMADGLRRERLMAKARPAGVRPGPAAPGTGTGRA
jgi:ribosomal protein S18 acetylase RimI-like enzyme